ncbi:acetate non-utilizing protein 9 [Actinomortierella ambigua]|nr:acetate non-utilizing protein 9 [Actinomortierella ambigua]
MVSQDPQGGSMSTQKALTPPLVLYRQILRAHRMHLPPHFRILGDGYVKAEFHRHKDVDNPLYIVGFLEQWQQYLDHIVTSSPSAQQGAATTQPSTVTGAATSRGTVEEGTPFGRKMDPVLLDKMSDQQLGQLYELRKEAKGLHSEEELAEIAAEEARLREKIAARGSPSA